MKLSTSSVFKDDMLHAIETQNVNKVLELLPTYSPNDDEHAYSFLNKMIELTYNLVFNLGYTQNSNKLRTIVDYVQTSIDQEPPSMAINYDKFYAALCQSSQIDLKVATSIKDYRCVTALLTYSKVDRQLMEYAYDNRIEITPARLSDTSLFHYYRYYETLNNRYQHFKDRDSYKALDLHTQYKDIQTILVSRKLLPEQLQQA